MKKNLEQLRLLFQPSHLYEKYSNPDKIIKNKYYTGLLNQYYSSKAYLGLYDLCTKNNNLKTDIEISYKNKIKFGCTLDFATKTLSDKKYYIHKNKALNTTIVYFRMLFGNHRIKCQMHFFNNSMFFFSYNFTEISRSDITEILKVLQEKYLFGFNIFNITNVIDSNNNCINIENNVVFSINYVSLNNNFFRLASFLDSQNAEKQLNLNIDHAKHMYCSI